MGMGVERSERGANALPQPGANCPFPADGGDPLARFIRERLGWEWPTLLIVTFIIYGPIEKFLIPALGGYLKLGSDIRQWQPDVEAIITGIVFPVFFAFYLWTGRGISNVFLSFSRNDSLKDPAAYSRFLERTWRVLNRWWWWALGIALALAIVLLIHLVLWKPPPNPVQPWFGAENGFHRLIALLLVAFVAYAMSQIAIREALAIAFLWRLWRELGDQLVIHPYHPDDAGGLGVIGRHAVAISYFLLAWTLFILAGSLLPGLRGEEFALVSWRQIRFFPISVAIWNPLILVQWAIFLMVVLLSFNFLLWPAHAAMKQVRDKRLAELSQRLETKVEAAQAVTPGRQTELEALLKEIGNLKQLRRVFLEDYMTWPFGRAVRRQIKFSTAVSGLNLLATALVKALGAAS